MYFSELPVKPKGN